MSNENLTSQNFENSEVGKFSNSWNCEKFDDSRIENLTSSKFRKIGD